MRLGRRRSISGASLVEVLVTMVILVLGILTVIRIYPLGFNALRHSESVTIAQRLAQAELDRWKSNPAGLPDLIAAVDPKGIPVGSVLDPTVGPDDWSIRSDVVPEEAVYWSDVNKTRKIIGEAARIPPPVPTVFGDASVYTLAFGPIEWPTDRIPSEQDADIYIQVYGSPMRGVDIRGMTPEEQKELLNNLGPRRYAIDYERAVIAVATAPYPRQLRADYSYRTRSGELKTAVGDVLNVPAGTARPYVEIPLGVVNRRSPRYDPAVLLGKGGGIEPGTELVYPKLQYVPFDQPFSPVNELQYKVVGNYPAAGQFGATIAFHPRAQARLAGGPPGTAGAATAYIDYHVLNWHVLREDKGVPNSPPYDIKLALPFIKEAGVTTEEGLPGQGPVPLRTYKGVVPSLPGVSVVAVDMEDGSLLVNRLGKTDYFTVDYRNGIVRLPETAVFLTPKGDFVRKPVAGRALRFYYQADGDWAVAVQKAASTYSVVAGPVRVLTYGTCMPLRPVLLSERGRQRYYLRVLFPIADQGKSVLLSYSYWDRDGLKRTVYGVGAQITDQYVPGISSDPNGELSGSSLLHPYVQIPLPDDVNPQRGVRVFDVRGTSLRAVTIWREGNRWKYQDVSTFLTRRGT